VGGDIYRSQRILTSIQRRKRVGSSLGHRSPLPDGFIRTSWTRPFWCSIRPMAIRTFPGRHGQWNTSSVTFTLEYDKRDDRFSPTKESYQRGTRVCRFGWNLATPRVTQRSVIIIKCCGYSVAQQSHLWVYLFEYSGPAVPFMNCSCLGAQQFARI